MRTRVKKLTSVILAVVMMLGILTIAPLTVSAATYGDFEYTIKDDYTVEITRYVGSDSDINIPDMIDGKKVTSIGDGAFENNKHIKNVKMTNNILSIGNGAYYNCQSLETIELSNALERIWIGSFGNCVSLKRIDLPDSLSYVDDFAFGNCESLETVNFPDELSGDEFNGLAKSVFENCINLTSIKLPNNLKRISYQTFSGCKKIQKITIPQSVTSIINEAFYNCTNLENIIIPKSVSYIAPDAFRQCKKLTISGYLGTVAETYAKENGFKFIALDVSEPTSVSLNKTSLTLDVGKSYTLTKTVSPSNAATSYTWRSSNTSVATVDSNGKVTAKKAGTATITVKTSNGKTATCKVTVNLPTPQITGLANTTGGIKISWNKVDGAYGYRLYYKPASVCNRRFKDTTATSFTDSGVVPNKTETYTIRCIDKNGNTVSGFNSKGWSKKYTPVAPIISKLDNTSGGIKLSWNKVTGVYGYRLYYKTSSGGWKRFKDTTATSFTDSGVSPNRTETYTIRCIDKNGNTISGFNSTGWSKKYTPAAPTISKLDITTGGIKLSWNKIAGVYGYRLYYKTSSGGWKRFKDTTATSFTDSGVSPNRTETYTIRCIDKNGNTVSGFYSRGWSKKYTPVAPTITRLSNTSKGVSVTWNEIAGVYGYRLYRKYDGGSWTKVKDTTSTSFTDSGAKKGKKVTYTVRCIDRKGKTVSGFNSKGWSITRK